MELKHTGARNRGEEKQMDGVLFQDPPAATEVLLLVICSLRWLLTRFQVVEGAGSSFPPAFLMLCLAALLLVLNKSYPKSFTAASLLVWMSGILRLQLSMLWLLVAAFYWCFEGLGRKVMIFLCVLEVFTGLALVKVELVYAFFVWNAIAMSLCFLLGVGIGLGAAAVALDPELLQQLRPPLDSEQQHPIRIEVIDPSR